MTGKNKTAILIALSALFTAMILLCIVLKLPMRAYQKIKNITDKSITVYNDTIDIEGYDGEFKIIYLADSHVALCDDRDADLKEKAEERYGSFVRNGKGPDDNLSLVMDYIVKENPDLVIFGGDMIDEATKANVEFLETEFSKLECPYIYLMGNHDFAYRDEYFSMKAYDEYLPRLSSINGDSDGIEVIEFDDFVILALDDNNYQVPAGTKDILDELYEDKKPVIVTLHSPIEPKEGAELIEKTNMVWPPAYLDYSRVLMGEHANVPNEETSALIEFISDDEGLVAGVLAGHIHFYSKDKVNQNAFQYVAPAGFERGILELTIK